MGVLDGLVAVVTGGGSGIGQAACLTFLREGASVGALDLSPGTFDSEMVLPVKADVSDQKAMDDAMAAVAEKFGGIDILINNAASAPSARSRKTPMRSGLACLTST